MTKILIIRFSSIGDLVITTAAIRCLKEQMPGCEIHLLVKPAYKEVLHANKNITETHIYQDDLESTLTILRAQEFDYIVDLQNNFRSRKVANKLGKTTYRVRKHNIQKWLIVNFRTKHIQIPHFAVRCIETLKTLGIINDGKGLDYIYNKPTLPPQILPDKPYYCIAMGGTHFTKRLPNTKLVELIEQLDIPVVLLGGKKEIDDAKWVEQKLYKTIYNHVGKLTLDQSAYLLDQSQLVVTNDTGLMHIAAALKKPIVSVWGNTVSQMGLTPYYGNEPQPQFYSEVTELSCRPCSKLGRDSCPKKHFKCMIYQDMDKVAMFVKSSLK